MQGCILSASLVCVYVFHMHSNYYLCVATALLFAKATYKGENSQAKSNKEHGVTINTTLFHVQTVKLLQSCLNVLIYYSFIFLFKRYDYYSFIFLSATAFVVHFIFHL